MKLEKSAIETAGPAELQSIRELARRQEDQSRRGLRPRRAAGTWTNKGLQSYDRHALATVLQRSSPDDFAVAPRTFSWQVHEPGGDCAPPAPGRRGAAAPGARAARGRRRRRLVEGAGDLSDYGRAGIGQKRKIVDYYQD